MRTSGEIDFRFRLKLKITLVESTYPSQRPKCPSLSPHFLLKQHMVVCGLSLHQGSTESRKTLEQKFIFQIGTLNPHGINGRFSFN